MTVYVDDAFIQATVGRHAARWCHLFTDRDDQGELHALARRIGLRRSWFQHEHKYPDAPWLWHYDLTDGKRRQAVAAGAVEIEWRAAAEIVTRRAAAAGRAPSGGHSAVDGRRRRRRARRVTWNGCRLLGRAPQQRRAATAVRGDRRCRGPGRPGGCVRGSARGRGRCRLAGLRHAAPRRWPRPRPRRPACAGRRARAATAAPWFGGRPRRTSMPYELAGQFGQGT